MDAVDWDEAVRRCRVPGRKSDIASIRGSYEHGKSLYWRHNVRDGVSNHRCLDGLLNLLLRRRSKKTSKFRVTGLCEGNSPVTDEFPSQRAINVENISIWWRHLVCWNMLQSQSKCCVAGPSLWRPNPYWQAAPNKELLMQPWILTFCCESNRTDEKANDTPMNTCFDNHNCSPGICSILCFPNAEWYTGNPSIGYAFNDYVLLTNWRIHFGFQGHLISK